MYSSSSYFFSFYNFCLIRLSHSPFCFLGYEVIGYDVYGSVHVDTEVFRELSSFLPILHMDTCHFFNWYTIFYFLQDSKNTLFWKLIRIGKGTNGKSKIYHFVFYFLLIRKIHTTRKLGKDDKVFSAKKKNGQVNIFFSFLFLFFIFCSSNKFT